MTEPGGPKNYRRRWRNLLLDKTFQLRFVLTWIVIAAALMAGLGLWVLRKADTATDVAMVRIDSVSCTPARLQDDLAGEVDGDVGVSAGDAPVEATVDTRAAEDAAPPAPDSGSEAEPSPELDPEPNGIEVTIIESDLDVVSDAMPKLTSDERALLENAQKSCNLAQSRAREQVLGRRAMIAWVLVVAGLLLLCVLFVSALKMTHRVAGPLYKISLAFEKMEKAEFETIRNLREGDRLVEFFETFRQAFQTMHTMHREDMDQLESLISVGESLASTKSSPALDEAIEALRERLATLKGGQA